MFAILPIVALLCKVVTISIASMYMDTYDFCCIENTLKIIGSKWTALLLRDLFDGTKRFGELQKTLAGISPRTLSARLVVLEKEGIVSKKVYPVVPLKVEYSLTKKGKSLEEIISKMREWGARSEGSQKFESHS